MGVGPVRSGSHLMRGCNEIDEELKICQPPGAPCGPSTGSRTPNGRGESASGPARGGRARVVSRGGGYGWTMSAVTMPNIPFGVSAWGRMWQWNAHVPGLSASIITSHRSPGATFSVSHFQGMGWG